MFVRNAEKKMSDKPQKKNAASRYGFLPDVEYLENYFALFDTFDEAAKKNVPYKLEGLMFVATVCGRCHFTVDLKEHILHPNELLLVLPGQMVQHVDKSADFQGRFMFMSSELLANISTRKKNFLAFFALRDNPQIRLKPSDMEMFLQYHDFIRKRMQDSSPIIRLDVVQHLLGALFFEFLAMEDYFSRQQTRLSRKDEICRQFLDLLIQHYKESRSVSFYADRLFITPKYLSATLRSVTGKRAGQLIDDYVLLQAKVMLKTTNMTVQQISEELNFANQSFFARYFKHLSGLSPTQYRDN